MSSFGVIDTFMLFGFLKRLTTSYTSWEAFKTGVINENGDIIVPPDQRTREQHKSLTKFDVLVMNLRKILAKIPGGGSKLATFAAALYLLKEDKEYENMEMIEEQLKVIILKDSSKLIMEEVTNSANPSAIAGLDNPPRFAGHRVFDVSMKTMMKSRFGKKPSDRYKKYLGEEDKGDEIRDYCRKNPKESIILRDSNSGQMIFLRKKH